MARARALGDVILCSAKELLFPLLVFLLSSTDVPFIPRVYFLCSLLRLNVYLLRAAIIYTYFEKIFRELNNCCMFIKKKKSVRVGCVHDATHKRKGRRHRWNSTRRARSGGGMFI